MGVERATDDRVLSNFPFREEQLAQGIFFDKLDVELKVLLGGKLLLFPLEKRRQDLFNLITKMGGNMR